MPWLKSKMMVVLVQLAVTLASLVSTDPSAALVRSETKTSSVSIRSESPTSIKLPSEQTEVVAVASESSPNVTVPAATVASL